MRVHETPRPNASTHSAVSLLFLLFSPLSGRPLGSHTTFRLLSTLLVSTILLLSAGCRSQEVEANNQTAEPQETPITMGEPITDPSIAVIVTSGTNSDTLTAAEFEGHILRVSEQFPMINEEAEQIDELRRTLVEQFATSRALVWQAEATGLAIDYDRVDEEIEEIKLRFDSEEAFHGALAEQDMTEAELRERLGEEVQRQLWQERIVEGVAEPSQGEVDRFRQEQAEQVRAQHILFFSPSPDTAVEARAEAVLDSVRNGVAFEELARRHSDDGSATQGGDLDYFSRGEMVEPFANAAFALRDSGDVTNDLVRTQFGYHIIRLTGRRLGDPMPAERASQILLQRRQQDALVGAIDRLRADVVVRVNPDVVQVELN